MKQNKLLLILSTATLAAIIFGFAWAEQLSFSTYYPAPYGVYQEFTTTSKTALATNSQATDPQAKVGIGTDTPSEKLDVIGNIHASGDVCIGAGPVCLSEVGSGSEQEIAIETGQIAHGGTIPVPDGYTQNQCKWIVSVREGSNATFRMVECYTDANGKVTCRVYKTPLSSAPAKADYLIICNK